MTPEHRRADPYGWSLRIDLYDCDASRLRSRDGIREFVTSLCDRILGMTRHGDLLIDWFGSADDKTGGFSFVQLIKTSSVVGHISESRRALYLDIFSCAIFDADSAAQHAVDHFRAGASTSQLEIRH